MVRIVSFLAVLLLLPFASRQQDTVSVMYYNVLNFPGTTPERVQYFRIISQYLQPDIIVISELNSEAGANLLLQNGLNVYGKTNYSRAPFIDGTDTDNMLFYKHGKFTIYSTDTIQTALRNIGEYVLYYNSGQNPMVDTVFINLYSAHLKASTGTDNQQKRLAEVMRYKQHVDINPNIKNMIFGGDLNLYSASEPAYNALITQGNYPLIDVLPAGSWNNNSAYAAIHTQSTRSTQFGGGSGGGLDDRFDFMLFTDDLLSGANKVSYIPNSYKAFGNDGNHFNLSITDPPANSSVPDSVLQALYYMTDHLPVISKFVINTEVVQPLYTLELNVFLEGPFQNSEMVTGINSMLPLSSPYSQSPWNMQNDNPVTSIPSEDIVDWVLIELRDAPDALSAGASTTFNRQSAFLLPDGSIKGTDGISNLQFSHEFIHELFVVIRHRNHLGIISASGLNQVGNTYIYNFTDAPAKAFGYNSLIQLTPFHWGMIAGDLDASGMIDVNDDLINWKIHCGLKGYLPGDLNFDQNVDNRDKNDFLIRNHLLHSNVPE